MKLSKDNFFNFKGKNIWDIGYPCSPRLYLGSIVIFLELIYIISETTNLFKLTN